MLKIYNGGSHGDEELWSSQTDSMLDLPTFGNQIYVEFIAYGHYHDGDGLGNIFSASILFGISAE